MLVNSALMNLAGGIYTHIHIHIYIYACKDICITRTNPVQMRSNLQGWNRRILYANMEIHMRGAFLAVPIIRPKV